MITGISKRQLTDKRLGVEALKSFQVAMKLQLQKTVTE